MPRLPVKKQLFRQGSHDAFLARIYMFWVSFDKAIIQGAARSNYDFAIVRPGRLVGGPYTGTPDVATLLKMDEGDLQVCSLSGFPPPLQHYHIWFEHYCHVWFEHSCIPSCSQLKCAMETPRALVAMLRVDRHGMPKVALVFDFFFQ